MVKITELRINMICIVFPNIDPYIQDVISRLLVSANSHTSVAD